MKKYMISLLAAALSLSAFAQNEKMIVTKTSGTAVYDITESTTTGTFESDNGTEVLKIDGNTVAPVSDIKSVKFADVADFPFKISDKDGTIVAAYPSVPSVLRVLPAEDGEGTQVAFGTVAAVEAADIPQGDYAVYLKLTAGAVNAGGVADLAESTSSYALKLYKYSDGELADSLTVVTEGSVKYAWNPKAKRLNLDIHATFKDGTVLESTYTGTPSDVESLADMFPARTLGDEIVIDGSNGAPYSGNYTIEVSKVSTSSFSGKTTFTYIAYKNGYEMDGGPYKIELKLDNVANKGALNLAEVSCDDVGFYFNEIQVFGLVGAVDKYKSGLNNGTIEVTKTDDEVEIRMEFDNKYDSYMGENQGDGQHIILHLKSNL